MSMEGSTQGTSTCTPSAASPHLGAAHLAAAAAAAPAAGRLAAAAPSAAPLQYSEAPELCTAARTGAACRQLANSVFATVLFQ